MLYFRRKVPPQCRSLVGLLLLIRLLVQGRAIFGQLLALAFLHLLTTNIQMSFLIGKLVTQRLVETCCLCDI